MSSDSKATNLSSVPFRISYNKHGDLLKSMIESLLKCLPEQKLPEGLIYYNEFLAFIHLELKYLPPGGGVVSTIVINAPDDYYERGIMIAYGRELPQFNRNSSDDMIVHRWLENINLWQNPKVPGSFQIWWNSPGEKKLVYDNSTPKEYGEIDKPISNGLREIRGPEGNLVVRTHFSNGKKNGEEEFWFFCGDFSTKGSFIRYYINDVEVTKGEYEREYKIPSQTGTASALSDFGVIKDITNITKEYLK